MLLVTLVINSNLIQMVTLRQYLILIMNKTKLEYEGDEDEIIKKIEIGNVGLPLNEPLISEVKVYLGLKHNYNLVERP